MDTGNSKPIRVILVDDHAIVRRGISEFLDEHGVEILAEADDGDEALRLIAEHRPDVVILDIQIPRLSGIEVARTIRAEGLPIGILILSAYDDDPFVIAAIEAGVNGYVLKTARPKAIVEAVHAVHEGQSVLDAGVVDKVMDVIAAAGKPEQSYEPLTEREREVLNQAARGLTNNAIGYALGISARTVQGHLGSIYEKLLVSNRTEAVVKAAQLGLLDLPQQP